MSDLKALKKEWDLKLKDSGFVDLEDSKNRLKSKDIRTQNFIHREAILNFFLALDAYLISNKEIPSRHRQVLEYYSAGQNLIKIRDISKYSLSAIKLIIKKYKKIVLTLPHQD